MEPHPAKEERRRPWQLVDDRRVDSDEVLDILIGETIALERLDKILEEEIVALWQDPSAMGRGGINVRVWAVRLSRLMVRDFVENERQWLSVIRKARRRAPKRRESVSAIERQEADGERQNWWVGVGPG